MISFHPLDFYLFKIVTKLTSKKKEKRKKRKKEKILNDQHDEMASH